MIDRLRRAWRAAREAPRLRRLTSALDTLWWLRTVLRSGLVDPEFYAAQRGTRARSTLRTSAHYVTRGFRAGCSPNPFFDEVYARSSLPDAGKVPGLYAYLVNDRDTVAVHPWWDSVAHAQATPGGPALERVHRDPGAVLQVRIGHRRSSVTAAGWRRAAIDACGRCDAGSDATASRVLLRPVLAHDPKAHEKIVGAADAVHAADAGDLLLLSCDGRAPGTWVTTALVPRLLGADVPIAAQRWDRPAPMRERLRAAARRASPGGTLAVADARAGLETEQWLELLRQGADGVVAPVSLEFDGTVSSAGTGIVATAQGLRIGHALRAHPAEDLDGLAAEPFEVPMLSGSTFAASAALVAGADDADVMPGFELESLSVVARRKGLAVRIAPGIIVGCYTAPAEDVAPAASRSVTTHAPHDDTAALNALYHRAGFDVLSWDADAASGAAARVRRLAASQRWAIKTCAPAGPAGSVWGDTHFANGLAAALRRLGHDVVVDAYAAAGRSTEYLDDVHVVVRGPFRIDPPPGGTRIEWIISHPDQITREEVAAFDAVFAVSPGWAERASERWGVPVAPLLEATDADLFHPRGLPRGSDVVFVGTARGIARPAVVAPISAGVDVRVYGPDWRGFIPGRSIAAPTIPNSELSARYETASVVLNDHWPAMRREGFMAMRPFDVVAAGGRVISESVPLLDEVFGGAVVSYEDEGQLVEMLKGDIDALFPSEERLAELAADVRRDHSFDARALVLDEAVRNLTPSGR